MDGRKGGRKENKGRRQRIAGGKHAFIYSRRRSTPLQKCRFHVKVLFSQILDHAVLF